MNLIRIESIDKHNWEEALSISLHKSQEKFVSPIIESLAWAYIKPWDEAFDPYILCKDDKTFGHFFLSYTPNSTNNYWIGGFQIDKEYQGMGLGTQSLKRIVEFIQETHRQCEVISLTIEKSNNHARKLYENFGFVNQDNENQYGEIIYKLKFK
ncbi:GNAT family N-acetyltransferase [Paenibacillus macquariensis]|uniref:Diamine N-acetyltransferase n=1 Tax=Paenibacillus macquariensis TaxID=948756 RepID=A0ABY1JM54_9BACL|nr:GNAT family N-acetyltransferase [Paenibacillus macquariensis]MEC0090601.1 GNAT family N-acetyltransferase [Paenibacillus macquariensis]OAB25022.1 GCN5 family acetyltransferase [Paenibacillus macquariensis subsp. macquariensis]SIQ44637.1 diamine N-acetyltransferase [Paenibacillus macquariensis]